jgi:hypothetical protein
VSRKIVDISIYLENDIASDPGGYRPEITYFNHTGHVSGGPRFAKAPTGQVGWSDQALIVTISDGPLGTKHYRHFSTAAICQ